MRKFHGNNGFTLVEVLISILLVSIAMMAVMSLVTIVIKGNLLSERTTTATTIAQDKMEGFIAMDIDSIVSGSGVTYETETSYNIDYYWYTEVEPDETGTETKILTVDVYWSPPASSSAHMVELKTFISE